MRILQVIPYFNPKMGGDVNVCYNISKQLDKRGHSVTILTTNFEFDKEYAESLKNIKVIYLKVFANIGLFLYTPSIKRWLDKEIRKFDIIHLHSLQSYQNNVVMYYAQKYNIPYVLQAHGLAPGLMKKSILKVLYNLVWGYRILRGASKTIALTNLELEEYKEMGVTNDKIIVIPNGIDFSEYENLPKIGEFRKKNSISDNEKIILFLGRIHKIKGLDLLTHSFSDLIQRLDNVKLVIVGPDFGYLSTLKELIKKLKIEEKIVFVEALYQKDKLSAYIDADIYILPSVNEGFGITALEACACGTPVIVTNRCGIADFVKGKFGYVVKYDKEHISNTLFKCLSDNHLKRRIGKFEMKLVDDEYGWDKLVMKVEDIYESMHYR